MYGEIECTVESPGPCFVCLSSFVFFVSSSCISCLAYLKCLAYLTCFVCLKCFTRLSNLSYSVFFTDKICPYFPITSWCCGKESAYLWRLNPNEPRESFLRNRNTVSGARFSKVPRLFGRNNSLCIIKTKESRDTKLCSYFDFYSL